MNRTLAIALATTFSISLNANVFAQFRPQPDSRSGRFSDQFQNDRGSVDRRRPTDSRFRRPGGPSRSAQESRRPDDSERSDRFNPRGPQRYHNNRPRSKADVSAPRVAQRDSDQPASRRANRSEQNLKSTDSQQQAGQRKGRKKNSKKRNRKQQANQGSDPKPTITSSLILPPEQKTKDLPPVPADQLPKIVPRTVRTPSYVDVYNSIPFSRATYNADPTYRHNGTMELLIGELRPQTIYQSPARPMSPMPSSYNAPQNYRGGRPGFNYFVIPGAPFTPVVPRAQGRVGVTLP